MAEHTIDSDTANDIDLLHDLIRRALRHGADAADAVMFEGISLSHARRLGKTEKLERSESRDLGLRVLIGKQQAMVSSSDHGGCDATPPRLARTRQLSMTASHAAAAASGPERTIRMRAACTRRSRACALRVHASGIGGCIW
jgi:predicted Zn-dependent protease